MTTRDSSSQSTFEALLRKSHDLGSPRASFQYHLKREPAMFFIDQLKPPRAPSREGQTGKPVIYPYTVTPSRRHTLSGQTETYLVSTLGRVLANCCAELCEQRPRDPIEFMARWLYRYADSRIYLVQKAGLVKQVVKGAAQMKKERKLRLSGMRASVELFKEYRKSICLHSESTVQLIAKYDMDNWRSVLNVVEDICKDNPPLDKISVVREIMVAMPEVEGKKKKRDLWMGMRQEDCESCTNSMSFSLSSGDDGSDVDETTGEEIHHHHHHHHHHHGVGEDGEDLDKSEKDKHRGLETSSSCHDSQQTDDGDSREGHRRLRGPRSKERVRRRGKSTASRDAFAEQQRRMAKGIARWMLDDKHRRMLCIHPVLGTLAARVPSSPPADLPYWLSEQVVCPSLYEHELYTCLSGSMMHHEAEGSTDDPLGSSRELTENQEEEDDTENEERIKDNDIVAKLAEMVHAADQFPQIADAVSSRRIVGGSGTVLGTGREEVNQTADVSRGGHDTGDVNNSGNDAAEGDIRGSDNVGGRVNSDDNFEGDFNNNHIDYER